MDTDYGKGIAMKRISQGKTMAVLLTGCILLIAGISDCKVMNFYINDEIDYNEWNVSANSKFETDYISNFWLKYQYVNLNGFMSNLLGQPEMNGIVKLNNGYLTVVSSQNLYEAAVTVQIPNETIARFSEQTEAFDLRMRERGIQYIYVILPYVVDRYNPQMPTGIRDFGNENLDRIKLAMTERGIQTIDLRECLHDDGMETYDIFYRTDHHWTTQGGFWAYNKLVDYLEDTNGFIVDKTIRDMDNYTVTTYEKWHLGSRGQRTGIYYAGIDDFNLILPKFDTYIERWGTDDGGTLQEMMIDMEPLESCVYTSRYTYDSVMGGSCDNWHNPSASVDKTVLIICDSMAKAFCPYMTLSFRNVLCMSEDVSALTEEFLDSCKPDIIISFYYPGNVGGDKAYDWGIR